MNESEAQQWVKQEFGADAYERVASFAELIAQEAAVQNLISAATLPVIWSRHIVDSAQLLTLAPSCWSTWTDVGTGGGFPGMLVSLLAPSRTVTMVEPRRKRADFLLRCVDALGLRSATVLADRIERVAVRSDVISARAVADVGVILRSATACAHDHTTWLLPRGRSGIDDLSRLPRSLAAMFHVEHSVTDECATILVGKGKP